MKAKILKIGVTGADGFIGKRLCGALEDKKYKLVRYDANNLDLRNKVELSDELDVIYHLAALNKPYLSKLEPFETFKVNVLGTLNLLEAARKANIKKIIFTSSLSVYKDSTKTREIDAVGYNGLYPYGFEKVIGEEYLKIYSSLFGIDYVILRMAGVYGPGIYKNPIFDIIQGFLDDNIKLYVNRNSVYNFVYIDDIVDALIASLNWKKGVFNLCSDENIKLINIYDFFRKELKKEVEIKDTDLLINMIGNNKKTKKKGWRTKYSLKDGLLETYNYLSKLVDVSSGSESL